MGSEMCIRDRDQVRYPGKALERLNYLLGGVTTADFRPTDQHIEVQAILRDIANDAKLDLDALLENELSEFNEALTERGLNLLVSPEE